MLLKRAAVVAAGLGVLVAAAPVPRHDVAAAPASPNIVLILSDDQRWDTMSAMPETSGLIGAHGVTFSNAFVVNPLCCPSRASILTGLHSHSTGVYLNGGPDEGFNAFDPSSTIATWLDGEGYRTALIGKYLNLYPANGGIPPGWDRWVALLGTGGYYDYKANVNGTIQSFGSDPSDYSTDMLAEEAVDFIRSTPADDPLFLEFAPFAPHGVATPADRHERRFRHLAPWRPRNFNEEDTTDKPRYIRALNPAAVNHVDRFRRRQLQTLLAVDEAVGDIVETLEDEGRLDDTMIVYASDNGHLWGEHKWIGKLVPYEESIRVPMMVRYDPLTANPRTARQLVLNIDLAPTFADLAGAEAPAAEGESLMPLLEGGGAGWRGDFLIEHLWEDQPRAVPTYCALRTRRFIYVKYAGAKEELYNLKNDPFQLRNGINELKYQDELAHFKARLAELCSPPPPGLSLP
ncbi:MAG: sulfatase [Actinomycetota bacterium]